MKKSETLNQWQQMRPLSYQDGEPCGDWQPYDGRQVVNHEAVNLPTYRRIMQDAKAVRYWCDVAGHSGFLALR